MVIFHVNVKKILSIYDDINKKKWKFNLEE